jgi:flavin reductase (DIM6/NTAB) family NADH-FMN oxidoreductase RutF
MTRPALQEPDASFRNALRGIPAAVAIVATHETGQPYGLTVSTVTPLSIEPAALLVCINRDADAHNRILRTKKFAVSILASGQEHIANIFAGRLGVDGPERFGVGAWESLPSGCLMMCDSVAAFDCELFESRTFGTHSVLIGYVVEQRHRQGTPALLYRNGGYEQVGVAA